MSNPDFNLLVTLDVLLAEGSVARAAERLRLSPSAMSRALARLRETTGDPLLVRAGRGLVPTPRALELRAPVAQLVEEAAAVLRPARQLKLAQLVRTFTLRTREGFVENFGAALIASARAQAPGVRLCFVPKPGKDSAPLREGAVDLETGVLSPQMGPEVRVQALFRDRFIGVVRLGHPLTHGEVTPARFAGAQHISVAARQGKRARGRRPGAVGADAADCHHGGQLCHRAGLGPGVRSCRHRARATYRLPARGPAHFCAADSGAGVVGGDVLAPTAGG